MVTAEVFEGFETLWKRRGVFDPNLTYGQAFAQYSMCKMSDPMSDFLYNAPYPAIKSWIEEQIGVSKKIDKGTPAQASRTNTN